MNGKCIVLLALLLLAPAVRAELTQQQLVDYCKNFWELTDLTDDAIVQTLNTSYSGIPFKNYVSYFFAAPDILNPLISGDYKTAGQKAATFVTEKVIDKILEGSALEGVAAPALLAVWPIEHGLDAFQAAVTEASFKNQIKLYFAARSAWNDSHTVQHTYADILALQDYDVMSADPEILGNNRDVVTKFNGWLAFGTSYLVGPVPGYTPDQFYEYAEKQWLARQAADSYAANQDTIKDAFRAAAAPQKPVITQQPQDAVIALGQSVDLNVTVTGTGPFQYVWELNGVPFAGPYGPTFTATVAGQYRVTVYDANDLSTQSRVATITVNSGEPVAITSPVTGTTLSNTITVRVGSSGATKIEFYLDGVRQFTDSAAPFAWTWNTATAPNGPHTLTAKAYNGATLLGTSAAVNVTVNNGLPSTCDDPNEPNDSSLTATPLAFGVPANGYVCTATDVDWFRVSVTTPGVVTFDLAVPAANDYDLELFGPDALYITGSYRDTGLAESITYNATVTGIYYVRVYGYPVGNGSYNASVPYTLTAGATSGTVSILTLTETIACLPSNGDCAALAPSAYGHSATGVVTATQSPAFCYSITVSNTSATVPLNNIVVTDDNMDVSDCFPTNLPSLFSLAPGASTNCTGFASINTLTTNTVTVFSGNLTNTAQAVAVVLPASISCVKRVSLDGVNYFDHVALLNDGQAHTVTYKISVTAGSLDLTNVVVDDHILQQQCLYTPFSLAAGTTTNLEPFCDKLLLCGPDGNAPLVNTVTVTASTSTGSIDDQGQPITATCMCSATVDCCPTPPVITATGTPANGVLGCNPTAAQIEAALGTATATGGVTPMVVTAVVAINGCARSQTRTWNAVDVCDHAATPVSRTATWAGNPSSAICLTLTKTDVSYNVSSDGTVTATFSCGTGPYTISLDGGAFAAATSPKTFSALSAGTHSVTVKDANGGSATQSITLNGSTNGPGAFTLSNLTPVCDTSPPVGPAVTLNWTASSGVSTYRVYRNSIAIGSAITGQTFYNNLGLAAGQSYTYFVRASNTTGTQDSNTITVNIPANVCGRGTLVSAALSTLKIAPISARADGTSGITATATLRDVDNRPVSGKTVRFDVSSSPPVNVTVTPRATTTDANGQATATMKSATPVTATVMAVDTTDSPNITVQQQGRVRFESGLVPPSTALANEIVTLTSSTTGFLSDSIPQIANNEGVTGDYFFKNAAEKATQEIVDTVFFGLDKIAGDAVSELGVLKRALAATDIQVGTYIDSYVARQGIDRIATSASGLSNLGYGIGDMSANYQGQIDNQSQSLLSGVPQESVNLTATFVADLELRKEANQVLNHVLQYQDQRLRRLKDESIVRQSDWFKSFWFRSGVSMLEVFTPPPVEFVIGAVDYGIGSYYNAQEFSSSQQSYLLAFSSLLASVDYSGLIYSNTADAYTAISQGHALAPLTGKILTATTELLSTSHQFNGLYLGGADSLLIAKVVITAFSDVTVKNTSQEPATFEVIALYYYEDQLYGSSIHLPMVTTAEANLNVGQSATVRLNYFDGNSGLPPNAGDAVLLYVIGRRSPSLYSVDFYSSPVVVSSSDGKAFAAKGILDANSSTNIIENPIKNFVTQNPSNQTYQAQIWVTNPFVISLVATVTQSLPSGVTVLSTDGSIVNSSIVWTTTIAPNNLAKDTFTFSLSTTPGALTNLPAPTLVFSDTTGTNNLSLQSVAASFNGSFPVQLSASIPAGVLGKKVRMRVIVTNLTSVGQSGSVRITLKDSTGSQVYNRSHKFSVAGSSTRIVTFILPGSLSPGQYSLTGSLSVNGGTGQVLAGIYTVPEVAPSLAGLQVKLNFTKASADSCSLKATLDGGACTNSAGQSVTIQIGSAQVDFVLKASGRGVSTNGTCRLTHNAKTGSCTVTAKLNRGAWHTGWADYGLVNAPTPPPGVAVTLPVTIAIGGESFIVEVPLHYTAKTNKWGRAK